MNTDEVSVQVVTPENAGCGSYITAKLNDQDFIQKTNVYVSFIFELYRVVMGSFLMLFVPRKCGDGVCGMLDNIGTGVAINDTAFGMNIATFCLFLCMYFAEISRENKMITYLHVNNELPSDDDAVGEALLKISADDKQSILNWDRRYLRTGQVAMVGFIVNAVLSCVVISNNYLDNKTLTALVTNILFMGLKINETYSITNTSENVFYSAYLNERVQFNDADPDKMIKVEEITEVDPPTKDEAIVQLPDV
jgi:hypothetical protein